MCTRPSGTIVARRDVATGKRIVAAVERERIVGLMAAMMDHPSVFMGGPSQQSLRRAERTLRMLEDYYIITEKPLDD